MASVPDDAGGLVQSYLEQNGGFLPEIGAEITRLTEEGTTVTLGYDDDVTNSREPRSVHGGALATVVDSAGGLALRPYLDNPVRGTVATVSLNIDYLSRATDDVLAHAEVVRAGSSIGVSRIDVEDVSGEEVAVGRGTYRIFDGEK